MSGGRLPRARAIGSSYGAWSRRPRWRRRLRWTAYAVAIAASAWRFGVLWTVLGVLVAIVLAIAAVVAWMVLMIRPLLRASPHRQQADELGDLVVLTHKRGEHARAFALLAELRRLAARYPREPMVTIELMAAARQVSWHAMEPALRDGLLDDVIRATDLPGESRIPRPVGGAIRTCLESMRAYGEDPFDARRRAAEQRLYERAPYLRATRRRRAPAAPRPPAADA